MRSEVIKFMRRALDLAGKAKGQTFPNPLVGALIVKQGKVVGSGFHKEAGGLHAEILALKEAGPCAEGASLFCTLEPCAHHGRTPPCVDEIIRSGIKEVYIGIMDPNPLTSGKGIKKLRKDGIKVGVGFLEYEIKRLNESFIKAMTKNEPFVTVKIAESLDGKIATKSGESKWITNQSSRKYAHDIRRFYDAIMVGINTVLKDDPLLEPSVRYQNHRLTKIVLDSDLRIPLDAKLLRARRAVIIAAVKKDKTKEGKLAKLGAQVFYTNPDKGRVDLKGLLKKLNNLEIRNILVEGGAELTGSFLDGKIADKALIFISPMIIGGRTAISSVGGVGAGKIGLSILLKDISLRRFKEDILIEGYLRYR